MEMAVLLVIAGVFVVLFIASQPDNKFPTELVSEFERCSKLMLPVVNNFYPYVDSYGNRVANICRLDITGITHVHLNSDPQKIIPHLKNAETLILMPDPQNPSDHEAVRVLTHDRSQIGWIPRSYSKKNQIFRRLMEGYEVFACVYDHGVYQRSGIAFCTITVVYYETPFDKGLHRNESSQE